MIKAFKTFLLTLCILLLSGYGQLFAHALEQSTFTSSLKSLNRDELASKGSIQTIHSSSISFPTSGTTKSKHKQIVTAEYESEENEFFALKKFLQNNDFIAAVLYTFISAFLFRYFGKLLPIGKQLLQFSCKRYILIQVFRI